MSPRTKATRTDDTSYLRQEDVDTIEVDLVRVDLDVVQAVFIYLNQRKFMWWEVILFPQTRLFFYARSATV